MNNILIPNPKKLEEKIESFRKNGGDFICILSSFDKTLTHVFLDGKKIPSLIYHLREGKYLSEEYSKKASELYEKYHPIEIDPDLDIETKRGKMSEWWHTHYDILIKCGMKKSILEDLVSKEKVNFREGALEFLAKTKEYGIPVVIMSSDGIGDAIPMFLEQKDSLHKNIHIISNKFIFDNSGDAVGVEEPVIHPYNKNSSTIKQLPIYKELAKRKNILLMGDSTDDLEMANRLPYDEIIKIGFFRGETEESKKNFEKNFDIIITNDGDMKYINDLLKKILRK